MRRNEKLFHSVLSDDKSSLLLKPKKRVGVPLFSQAFSDFEDISLFRTKSALQISYNHNVKA